MQAEFSLVVSLTYTREVGHRRRYDTGHFNYQSEWKINHEVFCRLTKILFKSKTNLFASHLNFQRKQFILWRLDPERLAVDAFTQD